MSLLTDPDYFLQSLRLAFLRLDAPIAAVSTAHLVHSLPNYGLSSHAHHAGLFEGAVPEFALSRSPGPIPMASQPHAGQLMGGFGSGSGTTHGGLRNRPDRSAKEYGAAALQDAGGITSHNGGSGAGGGVAGDTAEALRRGQSTLRHSETIVGRQGPGRSTGGTGGAGMRVQGKQSSWKPKRHQLEAWSSQSVDRSAASTLKAAVAGDGRPNFDDERTPLPSRQASPSSTPQPGSHRTFDAEGGESAHAGSHAHARHPHDHSSSTQGDSAVDYDSSVDGRPEDILSRYRHGFALDTRSLSQSLAAHQPESPTNSLTGATQSPISPDTPAGDGDPMAHTNLRYLAGDDEHRRQPGLAIPASLSDNSLAVDEDGFSIHPAASSLVSDELGDPDSDYSDEENGMHGEEDEEDDFEFSLHGRDATSSFEAVPPGVITADPPSALMTLVSPTNGSPLPSIAEAAENNAEGVLDALISEEDAALKAAQSARRRARRRVNISGRIPIPLGIPLSPELDAFSGSATSASIRTAPSSPAASGQPARSSPVRASSSHSSRSSSRPSLPAVTPANPFGTAGMSRPSSRPTTPSSPARPMSPTSPHGLAAHLLRSRSGRLIKTRQRSQTDPMVPTLSSTNAMSPLASIDREGRADNGSPTPLTRSRAFTSQSLSTSPVNTLRPLPGPQRGASDSSVPSASSTSSPPSPPPRSPDRIAQRSGTQPLRIHRTSSAGTVGSAASPTPSPLRPKPIRPSLTVTTPSTAGLPAIRDGEHLPSMAPEAADSTVDSNAPTPITPSTGRPPRATPSRSPAKVTDPYLLFPISKITPAPFEPPKQSALSAMLKSEDSSSSPSSNNPFNELYGALFAPAASSTGASAAMPMRRRGPPPASGNFDITMFYPFSKESSKPLKMALKNDLLVEEVIGCALWKYWDSGRKPSLCPDVEGANNEKWDAQPEALRRRLDVSNWTLRIADDDEDGEVDDDFPAPERSRAAKGFGNCFTIVEASAQQSKQNQTTDAQIQRKPSRIIKRIHRAAPSGLPTSASSTSLAPVPGGLGANSLLPPAATSGAEAAAASLVVPLGNSLAPGSYVGGPAAGTTPGGRSFTMAGSTAPLVFLRIRIPMKGASEVTTTLQVPRDMYLADVLEMTCRKRYLDNPKEWILTVPDRGIVVPLDRTVESLQGTHLLTLERRKTLQHATSSTNLSRRPAGGLANTNPNASIFKRLSEPPQPKYVTNADLNTNYRSYVVQRKMPMPLGRHERIFSLDNDYIHIMPSETKLVSGPVRTASYHISQVANCKTSRRVPSSFKLIVWRDKEKGDVKRYDFEAGGGRMAAEIAATVQALMQAYKEGLEREAQLSQQYQ